jgi:hypothetical protein|tara:strand:+ start:1604 stop:2038 length:435 start_codon:yes stop_codon:yes gene_type:complete
MNDSHEVSLSKNGPPETVLPAENPLAIESLNEALQAPKAQIRDAIAEVIADWPNNLLAWATLGDFGRDQVESYAAYRVGYHRGLDRLRQSGWKGSGFVLWDKTENLGFLRCLEGLAELSNEIGDTEESDRCFHFLKQLDPSYQK